MKPKAADAVVRGTGPPPAARETRSSSWARWALRLALWAIILAFLARYLSSSWRSASAYQWHFRPGPLSLSLAILLTGQVMLAGCWHLIVTALGAKVGPRGTFRAMLLSQLAKYVPGKVLTVVARVHLMRQAGVREETTVVAQIIEGAALCVSGVLVAAASMLAAPELLVQKGFYALLAVIPIGLAAMHPAVLRRPVNFAARKLGRPRVELRATYSSLLLVTICYASVWVVLGVGLYWLSAGVMATPGRLWGYVGAYALSWVAGFVCVVTPAGLGVREAAFAALLGPELGAAPAVALAILARLWGTMGEVVCAAVASNFRIRSFLPGDSEHDDRAARGN